MLKDKTTEKIRDPLTKKRGKKRDRAGRVGTLSRPYPTKKKKVEGHLTDKKHIDHYNKHKIGFLNQ